MRTVLCFACLLILGVDYSLSIILLRKLGVNSSITYFNDEQASFGPRISIDSPVVGRLYSSNPIDGCVDSISLPENHSHFALPFICLIKRGNCTFDYKVRAAYRGGFVAAIIFNHLGDDVFPMASQSTHPVSIPSTMVGLHDGRKLKKYYSFPLVDFVVEIHSNRSWDLKIYLIPVLCLCGIFFIGVIGMFIFRWYELRRMRRLCCLTSRQLWQLPQKKYSKRRTGNEKCVICLEDYEDGDLLRILPCDHAYHTKCIDPWLLNGRRVCPICKRMVYPQKVRPRSFFNWFHCNRVAVVDVNDESSARLMDESDAYGSNADHPSVDQEVTHYGAIASVVRRPRLTVDPASESTPLLNKAPVSGTFPPRLPIRVRHSAPCCFNHAPATVLSRKSYTPLPHSSLRNIGSTNSGLSNSKARGTRSQSHSLPCHSNRISSPISQSTIVSYHHSEPNSPTTRSPTDRSSTGHVHIDQVRAIVHCSQTSTPNCV